jgi:hypothetical protein
MPSVQRALTQYKEARNSNRPLSKSVDIYESATMNLGDRSPRQPASFKEILDIKLKASKKSS